MKHGIAYSYVPIIWTASHDAVVYSLYVKDVIFTFRMRSSAGGGGGDWGLQNFAEGAVASGSECRNVPLTELCRAPQPAAAAKQLKPNMSLYGQNRASPASFVWSARALARAPPSGQTLKLQPLNTNRERASSYGRSAEVFEI